MQYPIMCTGLNYQHHTSPSPQETGDWMNRASTPHPSLNAGSMRSRSMFPSVSLATSSSDSTNAIVYYLDSKSVSSANGPRSAYNEDRVLDVLPEKSCDAGFAEQPFIMSQALIASNEEILRGWEAFKIFPRHASLGLHHYPTTYRAPGTTELIALAIWQSPTKRLALHEIYEAIEARFPLANPKKQKSRRETIRHTLSLKQCFIRMLRPASMLGSARNHGAMWTVDPLKMKNNCRHRRLGKSTMAETPAMGKPKCADEHEPISVGLPDLERDSNAYQYQLQQARQDNLDVFDHALPETFLYPSEITSSRSLALEDWWSNPVGYSQPSFTSYYSQATDHDPSPPIFYKVHSVVEASDASSTRVRNHQHESRSSSRYLPYSKDSAVRATSHAVVPN